MYKLLIRYASIIGSWVFILIGDVNSAIYIVLVGILVSITIDQ